MVGMFDWLPGADPADPSSREAMLMRQKIALSMMARDRKGYPKTVGEGLASIGDSLSEAFQTKTAANQLAAYEKYQKEHPAPTAADLLPKTSDASGAVPAARSVATDETLPPTETAALEPSEGPMNDAQASQMAMLRGGQDNEPSPYQRTAALERGDVRSDVPVNPLLRDNVTRTLLSAQGVPQPNPTEGGSQSPTPTPASTATLTSPPEALNNRPIVRPDISAMPQVAQAGPAPSIPQINRITPPVTMPPQDAPVLPAREPMNKAEIEGYKMLDLGQRLQDPVKTQQGTTLIEAGKAYRTNRDADNMKQYELQMQTFHARALAQEEAERGALKTQQGIIKPPSGPAVAGGATDQRVLGGKDSPQRSGVITPPPVPYGTTPEAWAALQSQDAAKST